MRTTCVVVLSAVLLAGEIRVAPQAGQPETVVVRSGTVALHALFWRPMGRGPFPGLLLNHGSGRTAEQLKRLGPYEDSAYALGPVFARHGYAFLYLFRRGVGLSADQGTSSIDLMERERAARGPEGRNTIQMQLLEQREMNDALAGLAFLRARHDVDANDVGLVGHSFGGSLTVLMAARDSRLRAAVVFSAAGYSWDLSPELRQRLLMALGRASAPIFFIHAENDYSLSGTAMDAELARLGKPHRLEVYPTFGQDADEGHEFANRGVSIWERDVFAFLDQYMLK